MRGLYLVTDRALCGRRTLEEVVLQAVNGGVSCVQLREKDLSTRQFVEQAQRIKAILAPRHVPLVINDRVDVALAAGADGVHLGQTDMPCAVARRLLGPRAIIGLSVESWDDVQKAQGLDVNYLGISPVFDTATKTNTKNAWGLEGVARIRAFLPNHQLVAIGSMNAANAAQTVQAGAHGIAVVSAICAAPDPCLAAQELSGIIQAALTGV